MLNRRFKIISLIGIPMLALILAVTLMLPSSVTFAKHDVDATGKATLTQQGQSGIKGKITFVDNGATLTTAGTATGLVSGVEYRSLVYGVASLPGGPDACRPDGTILATMLLGQWVNNGDGTGTLAAVDTTGGYVSLSDIGTVSIRVGAVSIPGPHPLRACGKVSVHKAK